VFIKDEGLYFKFSYFRSGLNHTHNNHNSIKTQLNDQKLLLSLTKTDIFEFFFLFFFAYTLVMCG
jgi:hypothetical protein